MLYLVNNNSVKNAGLIIHFIIPVFLLLSTTLKSEGQNNTEDFKLLDAVFKNNSKQVALMLEEGANPNSADYYGTNALMFAVSNESISISIMLLEAGANPNLTDYKDRNTLVYAIESENDTIIRLIAPEMDNINYADRMGRTAMHYAAKYDNLNTMVLLKDLGADIDRENNDKVTPLQVAASWGHFYVVDFLLFYGARVNHTAKDGSSALHLASWYGNEEVSGLLMDWGADIELEDNMGNTPVYYSILTEDIEMVWYLAESGARLNHINNAGYTPLALAVSTSNEDLIDVITFYDFTEPKVQEKGNSALSIAYSKRNRDIIRKIHSFDGIKKKGIYISAFEAGTYLEFNPNEFAYGFQSSIYESRFGIVAGIHFSRRIGLKKVQLIQSENLIYQFREKRNFWTLSLQKDYMIYEHPSFTTSVRWGAGLNYNYGNYNGTGIDPPSGFAVVPKLGVMITTGNLSVFTSVHFLRTGQTMIPSQRFRSGLIYKFPFNTVSLKRFNPVY